MKKLIFALLTLFSCSVLSAQVTPPPENSDPAAKKVLDKIRKKYEGYKTVEAAFSLTLDVPTKPKDVQKGVIGQEGDKFRLEMDQQTIVSDGKTTWVYLKNNNEVQINNADPAGSDNGFMTPKDLLKRYQKGDFLYAITDKAMENGKLLTLIEFKPKDKSSEYSKFRLSVDEKTSEIKNILAFHKDGSRYTFVITRLNTTKAFNADYFKFDTKKYPGVKVEDLRM